MKKKLKTPQDYLDYFTKDFIPDENPQAIWFKGKNNVKILQEFRVALPENLKIHHPYIVFIIFVYLKKFKFSGKWEKVAWEIPIRFKDAPFILTHRKFGFEIISTTESEYVNKLAIEAIAQIHKAIKYAEALIEPVIQNQLKSGNVTLDNEYANIKNRYDFFRESASKEFDNIEESKNQTIEWDKGFEEAMKSYNKSLKKINAGEYFMTGMLDAYFSLLEHTLVLLLPFLKDLELSELNLENFIGENWKNKFKIIYSLNTDKEALKIFERLDKIKESYRNPLTHGYFQKNGHSFYIHMKNLGAIPMTLTKSNNTFRYHFSGLEQYTFTEICKCFDDFDAFLQKSNKTKFGIKYIQSGLSIAFDTDSCKMYQSQMTTVKHFNRFIDHMSDEHENAANMDW